MANSPIKTEITTGKLNAYMNSKENFLLMPNSDFGRRKLFSVPMNRQFSLGKNKHAGEYNLFDSYFQVKNKNWKENKSLIDGSNFNNLIISWSDNIHLHNLFITLSIRLFILDNNQ